MAKPPPSPARVDLWTRPAPEEDAVLEELAGRLVLVPRRSLQRDVYRAVFATYLIGASDPNPLHYNGSLAGRRYTPVGGPAGLYLSLDNATPLAELRKLALENGFPISTGHDPITVVTVNANVGGLLDLTDQKTRDLLQITTRELTEDWETVQAEHSAGSGLDRLGSCSRWPHTRRRSLQASCSSRADCTSAPMSSYFQIGSTKTSTSR